MMLEIVRAEGICMFDANGKKYFDLISGISVSNVGHRHPHVLKAIEDQLQKYLHLIVYGEYVQTPQVQYAKLIADQLPEKLNCVYFTNSGTEATEGAMKLAKRITGRTEFISFRNSYHGHTQGSLSVLGDEYWKQSFRPLIPGNRLLSFNAMDAFEEITESAAAVIMEPVQAEAGVILPERNFLQAIRNRCNETGTMLILDEIQTGMGRTGTLFCFQQYEIEPDILLLAKSFGGGLPLGAFISSAMNMQAFTDSPVLGHLTTFGGNAVCCAAGKAALEVLLEEKWCMEVKSKSEQFKSLLQHSAIKDFRNAGLLISLKFENELFNRKVIQQCISNGVVVDWFLFATDCMRLAPPLTISKEEIRISCEIILKAIDETWNQMA